MLLPWKLSLEFVSLAARFVSEIKLDLNDVTTPPNLLPGHVHRALSWCLLLDDDDVNCLWRELRHQVWSASSSSQPLPPLSQDHIARLLTFDNEAGTKHNQLGTNLRIRFGGSSTYHAGYGRSSDVLPTGAALHCSGMWTTTQASLTIRSSLLYSAQYPARS